MHRFLASLSVAALLLAAAGATAAVEEAIPDSGRIVIVSGGEIEIPDGEQADALIVLGGDARIAGTVNALVVVDGRASVTGATLESAVVIDGSLHLGAGTRVIGDVRQLGSEVTRAAGAEIGGSVRDLSGDLAAIGVFIGVAAIVLWIGFGIATVLAGLLLAGLAARQVRAATDLIRHETGLTIVIGLLTIVIPPIAAALLMVTVIGIPTGIGLLVVVWPAAAFVGYLVAAIWLGEWLLGRRAGAVPADRPYAAALLGLAVAFLIGFVPLVTAVLSIVGLGAVVLAAWRVIRGGPRHAPVTTAAPVPAGS